MTTFFFLVGLACAVAGIALLSVPAAMICGGIATAMIAYGAHGGDDGAA